MSWENPYHSGQAQEDRPDRLVSASLYGLKVGRPGHLSASDKPAIATQTLATYDSGKDFVDHISDTDGKTHAMPAGYVEQGHLGRALFVCPQPECTVAGGHLFLFTTIEQWAAHWNTFDVAVAPLFNCMVRVVTLKQLPCQTPWMRCSVISWKLIQVSMLMANGRI